MGLFSKRTCKGGLMDEIRCDEPSYLIWKWHPKGSQQGNSNRENAIRWGSSLRVKDGEVAVFVYNQGNGVVQDYIEGPYDEVVQTDNLPVLANIIGLAYDGGTPFQAEVYFINLSRIIQVKFGVPFFDIYDPRFPDFGIPVAVRGTISFQINDYKEFIKLNRLQNFSLDDFQKQIRDTVIRHVKAAVANAPATHNIPVVQIESKTAQINDVIEFDIKKRLKENFGVLVSCVDVGTIEIDKSSEGYRQLMAVTKDATMTKIEAETQDYVERLRIQREEAQYAQHKQIQSANIGAFQVEKQAEVGVAGAEAFAHTGDSGAGRVDLGSGTGFNPAAMAAGVAVGGAIGQNIAGAMRGMMAGVAPPPIPVETYHVVVNGQATGPYDINTLVQMVSAGQFNSGSLVWKAGMPQWVKAETIEELKSVFVNIPPIPPVAE